MLSAVHSKSGGGGWRVSVRMKLRLPVLPTQVFFQPFPAEFQLTRNPVEFACGPPRLEDHGFAERLGVLERADHRQRHFVGPDHPVGHLRQLVDFNGVDIGQDFLNRFHFAPE